MYGDGDSEELSDDESEELIEESEGEDDNVFNKEEQAYMEMLANKATEDEEEEEDFYDAELEEELNFDSPLDAVDVYVLFRETWLRIQSRHFLASQVDAALLGQMLVDNQ